METVRFKPCRAGRGDPSRQTLEEHRGVIHFLIP